MIQQHGAQGSARREQAGEEACKRRQGGYGARRIMGLRFGGPWARPGYLARRSRQGHTHLLFLRRAMARRQQVRGAPRGDAAQRQACYRAIQPGRRQHRGWQWAGGLGVCSDTGSRESKALGASGGEHAAALARCRAWRQRCAPAKHCAGWRQAKNVRSGSRSDQSQHIRSKRVTGCGGGGQSARAEGLGCRGLRPAALPQHPAQPGCCCAAAQPINRKNRRGSGTGRSRLPSGSATLRWRSRRRRRPRWWTKARCRLQSRRRRPGPPRACAQRWGWAAAGGRRRRQMLRRPQQQLPPPPAAWPRPPRPGRRR